MREHQSMLTELLGKTEEILNQANAIDLNMKENEPEQLEKVQALVEKREEIIQTLAASLIQQDVQWATDEQEAIQKLKNLDQSLQERMNLLYQSFSNQIDRIQQTKTVSSKYFAAYQPAATDGVFFDKRK